MCSAGIPVDVVIVVNQNIFLYADESFKDTGSFLGDGHEPGEREVRRHFRRGTGQRASADHR